VKFISSTAGSGNTMTYFMRVPHDPKKKATNNGKVVDAAELSPAIWFGLPLCDPKSYPQNPCTPDSDTNTGLNSPTDAGSAFMELQFYAPGFTGPDEPGCLRTKWCSALTIDSVESQFNFVNLNPNCMEPQNIAFLQRNGVPAGPPSPQLSNAKTVTPNRETLTYNPGDVLKISISDPSAGFTTRVTDLTTHQSGFMVASAHNGFANTDFKTCNGTFHTFHAEYSTAMKQKQVPWAALEGGVLMQEEIGHAETCSSLTSHDPVNAPGFLVDKKVFDTCVGGTEADRTATRLAARVRATPTPASASTLRRRARPGPSPARATTSPAASCASTRMGSACRPEPGRSFSGATRPRKSHR
jgi:hypothetical protein